MGLPADLILRAASGAAAYDGQGGMAQLGRIAGFAPDTPVDTMEGEMPVGELSPGDLIITPDGAAVPVLRCLTRNVDATAMARQPGLRPIRLEPGALGHSLPHQALLLAPDQPVQVGRHRAAARMLVNGTTIRPVAAGDASFVRLVLGVPGAVKAAGLACPARPAPMDPAGAVSLRVLADRRATAAPGRLAGRIEEASPGHVVGWALDSGLPDAPVPLEIALDGVPIAWAIADQRRPDLEMRGLGNGACAFAVRFPAAPAGRTSWLTVRRASDGADVPGSPVLLTRAAGTQDGPAPLLARLAAAARSDPARNELAGFLFSEIDRITGTGVAP